MQALGKCCFRTEKAIILYNDQTDSLQLKQPMLQGGIRFLDIQVVPPRASSKRKSTAATAKTPWGGVSWRRKVFFQGGTIMDYFERTIRIFPGGAMVLKFYFIHSKLKENNSY